MVSMGVWILGMRIVVRKRWGRRIWRCCGRQAGGGVFRGAMACLFLFLVSGILSLRSVIGCPSTSLSSCLMNLSFPPCFVSNALILGLFLPASIEIVCFPREQIQCYSSFAVFIFILKEHIAIFPAAMAFSGRESEQALSYICAHGLQGQR